MRRRLGLGFAVTALLAATACNAGLPVGESGSIPLVPFFNEDLGIQSVVPLGCAQESSDTHNCSSVSPEEGPLIIVQVAIPGSKDGLVNLVLEQTTISRMPQPSKMYKGSEFVWELFRFESQFPDAGPQLMQVDLALAENDATALMVAMVTLPEQYERHPVWYDSVFTHSVYALSPLPDNGRKNE